MIEKLKNIAIGLFAFLAIAFSLFSKQKTKALNKEKHQRYEAERNLETVKAGQHQSSEIRAAKDQARNDNQEAREHRENKPIAERRSGRFGSSERLRD